MWSLLKDDRLSFVLKCILLWLAPCFVQCMRSFFLLVAPSKVWHVSLRLKTRISLSASAHISYTYGLFLGTGLLSVSYLSLLSLVKDLASAYTRKLLRVHDLRVLSFPTSINEPYAHSLSLPLILPLFPPFVLFHSPILLVLSPKSYSVASAISFHAR